MKFDRFLKPQLYDVNHAKMEGYDCNNNVNEILGFACNYNICKDKDLRQSHNYSSTSEMLNVSLKIFIDISFYIYVCIQKPEFNDKDKEE